MTAKELELPELPEAEILTHRGTEAYTADQMRAYALAALASDTGGGGVVGGAAADLAAVMEVAAEASAVPLQWQASTDFTPEQCKDWLAEAVSENVKAGDFTGELHSIAEFESGLTVAFTGCGPKSAANAKFLIWCAHFILKHGDTVAAALRAQPAGDGEPMHPSGRPYASKSEMKRVEVLATPPESGGQGDGYAALHGFARELLSMLNDGGPDGGDVQRVAESHGLLTSTPTIVPCGEDCPCAEFYNHGEESDCYRRAPWLTADLSQGGGNHG